MSTCVVNTYVRMYLCMYIHMHICNHIERNICVHVHIYTCICRHTYGQCIRVYIMCIYIYGVTSLDAKVSMNKTTDNGHLVLAVFAGRALG